MKEVFGDLWTLGVDADAICLTTNGSIVRLQGGKFRGVMGRGVAKQGKDRFPDLEMKLGLHIQQFGNHVGVIQRSNLAGVPTIVAFPVKHTWELKADFDLIVRSAEELTVLAKKRDWKTILLPRPGCGNGGRSWESVRPLLIDRLPDTVSIIELP
jgi:hypothetical protein